MFIKFQARMIKGDDLESAELTGKEGDWYIGTALVNTSEIEFICEGEEYCTFYFKSGQSIDIYSSIEEIKGLIE